MSGLKIATVGVYGPKQRALQKRLAFERVSLTHKTVVVWRYLGSRTNITPSLEDIPDPIFLEVADRAYDTDNPVEINAFYEFLPESQFDLSRFGIINPLGNTQQFRFHTNSFDTDGLGRYLVEGDILEVPFLAEGDTDEKSSYWEVTDVDVKSEFENFFVVVTTTPMNRSQETSEIPGNNTNDDLLEQLQQDMEDVQTAQVANHGFDDTAYDEITENPTKPYDPRPDIAEDFLDNPTKKVF